MDWPAKLVWQLPFFATLHTRRCLPTVPWFYCSHVAGLQRTRATSVACREHRRRGIRGASLFSLLFMDRSVGVASLFCCALARSVAFAVAHGGQTTYANQRRGSLNFFCVLHFS